MSEAPPVPPFPDVPVTSVAEAIERMRAIDAALPATDGIACFNRMYLDVTVQVETELGTDFYKDPAFMNKLDVAFANLYFDAVAKSADPDKVPLAWRPLVEQRSNPGIEEIQFALAGMNAHINHDLPIAMVETCRELETAPDVDPHHADYEKVDKLLDKAEQDIRESFETKCELAADERLAALVNFIANWGINCARDLAWKNSQLLWVLRHDLIARGLFLDSLSEATALAARLLLVAV